MTDDERIPELLRRVMPPVRDAELERDLWPRMLRRLDERPVPSLWKDLVLAVLALGWACLFPELIPALLYHL